MDLQGLRPVVSDKDLEPLAHALESAEAALKTCGRIGRALDLDEAKEFGAEVYRHLENVRGKLRETRHAVQAELEVRDLLLKVYDCFETRKPIPDRLAELVAVFCRNKLGVDPR
jgi:hypothetical protein